MTRDPSDPTTWRLGEPMEFGGSTFGRITSLVRREGVLVQIGSTLHRPGRRPERYGFLVEEDGSVRLDRVVKG